MENFIKPLLQYLKALKDAPEEAVIPEAFTSDEYKSLGKAAEQLKRRVRLLVRDAEAGKKKSLFLERANELITHVTIGGAQKVMVFDGESGKPLYMNKSAEITIRVIPGFFHAMARLAAEGVAGAEEETMISFRQEERTRYYTVTPYRLIWGGKPACATVAHDITHEKERKEALEHATDRDELTGMYNRHAGLGIVNAWVEQGKRFTLCFFDLDNLKYVNDVYGYSEGDNYISDFAGMLVHAYADGVASRLGGDEFMLLAPDVPFDEVEERIRKLCLSFQKGKKIYQRRISFGCVPSDIEQGVTPKRLLSLADGRMYDEKRQNKIKRTE